MKKDIQKIAAAADEENRLAWILEFAQSDLPAEDFIRLKKTDWRQPAEPESLHSLPDDSSDEKRNSMPAEEKFTGWILKILAISKAGLTYSTSPYEIERCHELETIGYEMLKAQSSFSMEQIHRLFSAEEGYTTPKIDTRAALFQNGKILLVHENNDTWALPGGWCEAALSVGENAVKETLEEAGYFARPQKLIALQDWRLHNRCNLPFGVIKAFVECRITGKAELDGIETSEAAFFSLDELPESLALEKNTKEQIALCFRAHESDCWQTEFD